MRIDIIRWIVILLIVAVILGVLVTYGNKPISEVPLWAVWLLGGK